MFIEDYKKGDIVRVWSLQSFYGGGFLEGALAIVRQDQYSKSVTVMVERKIQEVKNRKVIDTSYEVYPAQTHLVKRATEEDKLRVDEFLKLNFKVRESARIGAKKKGIHHEIPLHYALEFYFDDDMKICLNKNWLEYPELLI